jgi:hypothetical protein
MAGDIDILITDMTGVFCLSDFGIFWSSEKNTRIAGKS